MRIEDLLKRHDGPLPDLTRDERRQAELMLRLVKAGLLAEVGVELHRRDGVLLLEAVLPAIGYKCKK